MSDNKQAQKDPTADCLTPWEIERAAQGFYIPGRGDHLEACAGCRALVRAIQHAGVEQVMQKAATPTCCDPTAPIVKCANCGKEIHSCYPTDPATNYRCPVHSDKYQIEDGRWVCSEGCHDALIKLPPIADLIQEPAPPAAGPWHPWPEDRPPRDGIYLLQLYQRDYVFHEITEFSDEQWLRGSSSCAHVIAWAEIRSYERSE